MTEHQIASHQEWLEARRDLLDREKAHTRARDALSAARRALPWVRVEKSYVFDTPDGPRDLAGLFGDKSQLIVKHFMFGPDWTEGCVGCSFLSDHLDGQPLRHLARQDVAYVAVSRAPLPMIAAFRRRMGWSFPWVSSFGSDFNYDFGVSFTPEQQAAGADYNYRAGTPGSDEMTGMSVFARDAAGAVFHTYSCYARAGEAVLGVYALLDLTPRGREEGVRGNLMDWVRLHDRYGAAAPDDCCAGTP